MWDKADPLHVEGCNFVDDKGRRRIICSFDAFRALEVFAAGRSVQPIVDTYRRMLDELARAVELTGDGWWVWPSLRVFGMYNGGIGKYLPQDNPQHYTNLRALIDWF